MRKRDLPNPFDAMRASLKAGVAVVAVPQLFETPPDVADHLVELAGIRAGHSVLEPSAGTGRLLDAITRTDLNPRAIRVLAVELDHRLVARLRDRYPYWLIADSCFLALALEDPAARFDRVVMNPPFANGSDITHIQTARSMLAPGGRLVAVCANGPRQQRVLRPNASSWEELPGGTFRGTGVHAALAVFEAS